MEVKYTSSIFGLDWNEVGARQSESGSLFFWMDLPGRNLKHGKDQIASSSASAVQTANDNVTSDLMRFLSSVSLDLYSNAQALTSPATQRLASEAHKPSRLLTALG